jgi:hypothetical protein
MLVDLRQFTHPPPIYRIMVGGLPKGFHLVTIQLTLLSVALRHGTLQVP